MFGMMQFGILYLRTDRKGTRTWEICKHMMARTYRMGNVLSFKNQIQNVVDSYITHWIDTCLSKMYCKVEMTQQAKLKLLILFVNFA